MNDLGADRSMNGDGNLLLLSRHQYRSLCSGQCLPLTQRRRESLSHALLTISCRFDCLIHLGTSFLRHAEAAVGESFFHVLTRAPESSQLVIVYSRRAVHCDMADDALHEPRVDERTESDLHHMSAE